MVEIRNISFSYGDKRVIKNVTLTIQNGEILSLLGPSGCGKSTLLRLIAGLEVPIAGFIKIQGVEAGTDRNILRFLFQDYDAYPWYTVWQNVQLGSGPKPYPSDDEVEEILVQVGLDTEYDRYPGELSGGMRKRLGLARCMVRRPSLLLLDEPFSSLDIDTRYNLYELVQGLWRATKCSVVIVTHDLHEAILLSDRVLVSGPRPLMIQKSVDISFSHPRGDNISDSEEYLAIRRDLMGILQHSSAEKKMLKSPVD